MFSVNKFICSSVSVDTNGSSHLSASLYLMERRPLLDQHNNKTIQEGFECEDEFCYSSWRSYMHEGSSIDVTAVSTTAYFIHFDSDISYNNFISDYTPYITKAKQILGELHEPYNTNVGSNIFVLFGFNGSSGSIALQLNLTEYSTDDSDKPVCDTHSYKSTKCKAPVSYGLNSIHGLVKVTYDGVKPNDHLEYLSVKIRCNYRASSWTAIWLPLFIINSVILSALCYCGAKFIEKLRMVELQKKINSNSDRERNPETQPLLDPDRVTTSYTTNHNEVTTSTTNHPDALNSTTPEEVAEVTTSTEVHPDTRSSEVTTNPNEVHPDALHSEEVTTIEVPDVHHTTSPEVTTNTEEVTTDVEVTTNPNEVTRIRRV